MGGEQVTKQHIKCNDTFVSKNIYACIMLKAWKARENTSSGYLSMGRERVTFFLLSFGCIFQIFNNAYVLLIIFQLDKKHYKDFVGIQNIL